jgi:hypothetical protein
MGCSITGQTSKLCMDSSTTKIAAALSYGASTNTGTLDPTNSLQRRDYLQGGSHHGGNGSGGQPSRRGQHHQWISANAVVLQSGRLELTEVLGRVVRRAGV